MTSPLSKASFHPKLASGTQPRPDLWSFVHFLRRPWGEAEYQLLTALELRNRHARRPLGSPFPEMRRWDVKGSDLKY